LKREHRVQHLEAIIQQLESALHGLRRLQVELARDVTPVTDIGSRKKSARAQVEEALSPARKVAKGRLKDWTPEDGDPNLVRAVWKNKRLWPP